MWVFDETVTGSLIIIIIYTVVVMYPQLPDEIISIIQEYAGLKCSVCECPVFSYFLRKERGRIYCCHSCYQFI